MFERFQNNNNNEKNTFGRLFAQQQSQPANEIQVFSGRQATFCIIPGVGNYIWGKYDPTIFGLDINTNTAEPQLITIFDKDKISSAALQDHFLFLTANGKGYGCGLNASGQLGIGTGTEHIQYHNTLQCITELMDKRIIAIAIGANHSVYLTDTGKVFSYGDSFNGQLKIENNLCEKNELKNPLNPNKVVSIAAGVEHTLLLTAEGKVFSCGSNTYGQLGLGFTSKQNQPQLIASLSDQKIVAIASGEFNSVFLTAEGSVYCCGYNLNHEAGLGHYQHVYRPQLIPDLNNIASIAAGGGLMTFLTKNGDLYIFGEQGKLDFGPEDFLDSNKPIKLSAIQNQKITKVAIGSDHLIFITDTNKIYSSGHNSKGQLGLGFCSFYMETNPKEIVFPKKEFCNESKQQLRI